jgi:hypothetical protein
MSIFRIGSDIPMSVEGPSEQNTVGMNHCGHKTFKNTRRKPSVVRNSGYLFRRFQNSRMKRKVIH